MNNEDEEDLEEHKRLQKLETILLMTRYSCVAVELSRGLSNISGFLYTKILLNKLEGIYKIKDYADKVAIEIVRQKVELKLLKIKLLFERKIFNHCATGFMSIKEKCERVRKLKKYEELEMHIEAGGTESESKLQELEKLNRKYNRLLSEFSVLTKKSTEILKK